MEVVSSLVDMGVVSVTVSHGGDNFEYRQFFRKFAGTCLGRVPGDDQTMRGEKWRPSRVFISISREDEVTFLPRRLFCIGLLAKHQQTGIRRTSMINHERCGGMRHDKQGNHLRVISSFGGYIWVYAIGTNGAGLI